MRAARSTIDQAERKLKPRSRVPGSRCTFPYFSRSGAVFKISRETCCSHASGYACSWATNDGVEGRLSLSEQEPSTVTAPPDRRGGTYERDSTARAVLWYGTDTIHDLRREQKATTIGSDADRDIQIIAEHISGHHCRIENRARGTVLVDERSKNGTYYETRRSFGAGLKPSFDETRVPAEGFRLRPGTTFIVGDLPHRYIAIDDEIRRHHPILLDLLGTEDEVRDRPELVSPSDFILAADGVGHLLITGDPTCEPLELARIAHKISKRRGRPLVQRNELPADPAAQRALVTRDANKAAMILNLLDFDGDNPEPFDPRLITLLFSPTYQIRIIVLARNVELASALLGAMYVQPMMRVALRPLVERRSAIEPMLDRWLAARGSPLRVADLTPSNRRRILKRNWRSFRKLRELARRLDVIVRAPSLNQARLALGVARSTFYTWFGRTLKLEDPLVSEDRKPALLATLAGQPWRDHDEPAFDDEASAEQGDDGDEDE